jgi:hypothetical protein
MPLITIPIGLTAPVLTGGVVSVPVPSGALEAGFSRINASLRIYGTNYRVPVVTVANGVISFPWPAPQANSGETARLQLSAAGTATTGLPRPTSVARLQRGAARGITAIETVIATPLAPTVGAANANSTVNAAMTTAFGSGMYQPNDATKIEQVGGILAVSGSNYAWQMTPYNTGTLGYRGVIGNGIRFATDCTSFDFVLNSTGAYIVYITEDGVRARAQDIDYVGSVSGSAYYRFDLPSRKNRIIEIYTTDIAFLRGINVDAYSSIWLPAVADEPRMAVIWDSYGFHTNNPAANITKTGVTDFFAAMFGSASLYSMSIGSTGFLNPNGTFGNFQFRVENGAVSQSRIGLLDLVACFGSVNDDIAVIGTQTDAALAVAVTATFTRIASDQPQAVIVGGPPQSSINRPGTQARADVMKAAFLAVAALDTNPLRFVWVDSFGEGALGGTASVGKNSLYIATAGATGDSTHLNAAGQKYYGRYLAQRILDALRIAYGYA